MKTTSKLERAQSNLWDSTKRAHPPILNNDSVLLTSFLRVIEEEGRVLLIICRIVEGLGIVEDDRDLDLY